MSRYHNKLSYLGFLSAPSFGLDFVHEALFLWFVHLVAQHDEREIFWVSGHGLDEELLSPTVKLLE